jgi:fibronectin-binding autotransporter adhesin
MHLFRKSATSRAAVAAGVVGLALWSVVGAPRSQAATLTWVAGSGVFSDAGNWDPAQAPATDDTTIFTNDTSFTVTLNSSSPVMDSSIFSNHAGAVTINAGGNTWTITNAFRVGVADATSTVYLAGGTLSVADFDSPFVASQLRIGDSQTNVLNCVGTLVITNGTVGADVTVIGANATSVGNLIISGSGVLQDGGSGSGSILTVGAGSSGSRLIVTNGGQLIVDGTITVGSSLTSSNNFVLFSGPTSRGTMTSRGMLLRGQGSLLVISNGAKVFMASNGTIGSNASGCTGIVVGAGSELTIAGTAGLQVGANSSGGTNNYFLVYDGARFTCNGTLAFGNNAFHVNDGIQIGGPGLMSTGFAIFVRSASNNTNHFGNFMRVTNGFFSCNYLNPQGPQESVSIFSNGTWKLTNGFAIAQASTSSNSVSFNNSGNGNFLLIDGGTMINIFSVADNNPGGLSFGGVGGTSLIITNGGRLFTSRGTLGADSSFNTGIVVGAGSVWSNAAGPADFTNVLIVGTAAGGSNNFLQVSDGAKLYNNGTFTISGNATGAFNTVVFGGPGLPSTIVNSGSLNIGQAAGAYGNTLIVSNATLICDALNVGNSDATNNVLEFRGGTISVTVSNMVVRPSNTVVFAAGTLSTVGMRFDTLANNSNAFVVGDASSPAYYDMVAGGSGYHNFNTGGLVVTNGAFLRGNGTLAGNVGVSGTFEPGFSVGSIYSSNTLRFGSTAVLNFDLGTLSDSVTVNGSLILGGTLNVTDSGGFGAGTYTLFTHTNQVSGTLTVGTLPAGFTATVSTDTLPFVRLIVTPVGGGDPYTTWATFYGLSGGNAAGGADPDGDGMSNTNEFLAGFNPTNSSAYLRVINVERTGSDIKVTYLGANGDSNGSPGPKTNILEFTTGAAGNYSNNFTSAGVTNILSGGNGSGLVTNMVDVGGATSNPARYYRVRVLLP